MNYGRRFVTLGFLWKEWCWSWSSSSSTLATSCEQLTQWKRLWCWEGLGAGGEGDDRGWDGWMASRTRWTWVWVNSGRWWWTGRPGVLRFMGSQRAGHDWATELKWTEQETRIKTIPMEKKCKKAKWLSEEALQIAVKRREVKSKGEKEKYKHLDAEFQRTGRPGVLRFMGLQRVGHDWVTELNWTDNLSRQWLNYMIKPTVVWLF